MSGHATTRKRAKEIKKRYTSSTASQARFERLFNTEFSILELHYDDCSEEFTLADVEKLIGLACELELDQCGDFDEDEVYQCCAPVHAMNALLLLVASDRSIADTVARRLARRCAETIPDETDFVADYTCSNLVALLTECGPPAIPYLVTEMRKLLLTPHLPNDSWLGASNIADAFRGIILECYKDIPLAISLTDQFCEPLLEFGNDPVASTNSVNQENASYLLAVLVEIAILITDEKEVLELCRSDKCRSNGYEYRWIDVLRLFSLEPHPQDERLRVRGNRLDWVIQTWNENHPDKQFPFPRGVVDGPFPGQPGYKLPKRLFRHKYCQGIDCRSIINTQFSVKVCERCKHKYYCSEECQRKDWYGYHEEANRLKLESFPPKFRSRPLKRLAAHYTTNTPYRHLPHCLLVQAYKRWVKKQKMERKAAAAVEEGAGKKQSSDASGSVEDAGLAGGGGGASSRSSQPLIAQPQQK